MHRTLIVSLLLTTLLLLSSIQAFSQPVNIGEQTALLYDGPNGLRTVKAVWTQPDMSSGDFKFATTVSMPGNYSVNFRDLTTTQVAREPHPVSQSEQMCNNSSLPSVYLIAGHKYEMSVDISTGGTVGRNPLDERLSAKTIIFYQCQGQ